MQENVVRLEISVNDVLSVQIVHPLSNLTRNIDQCVQLKPRFVNVDMLEKRRSVAPLRYNRKRWLAHTAHE